MPGVRLLGRCNPIADRTRGGGGWRSRLLEALPAVMLGLTPVEAGREWHSAKRVRARRKRAVGGALKVTQSNKRMHATADTLPLIFLRRLGRAGDVGR